MLSGIFGRKKTGDDDVSGRKVTQDDFQIVSHLGKGAHGKVTLVLMKDTNELYAMKVIPKDHVLNKGRLQDLFSERSVMRRIRHPFITRLEYAFQSTDRLFFVMQYMDGGNLDEFLNSLPDNRLPEEVVRFYAAQIYLALQFLHENDIIYRDVKPENILLDSLGHSCLADFGLARDFQLLPQSADDAANPEVLSDRTTSFVGSPFYVAPDVLRQQTYGKSVDWWSFGILIARMLTSKLPFSSNSIRDLFDCIMFDEPPYAEYRFLSTEAQDLITQLLLKEENMRLTGQQIRDHPWFQDVDWDAVYNKEYPIPEFMGEHAEYFEKYSVPLDTDNPASSQAIDISSHQQGLFDGFTYVNSGLLSGLSGP
uniref:non-specific serine/threonine protein kinase n=1 Tax=Eutreptiella gymnastica TaxID=73025 RepID=A0A7S1HWB9_9EUGL|mmetsp:Transcript_110085/g.190726  ORF Transcript_110085/g.190726 Transcript_110085/m.190726 type:complete len:367 (+) Transcript_110085:47-1147(+)